MQDLDLISNTDASQVSAPVVHLSAAAKVNFASAQNGVAVIKDLRIENHGPVALEGVRLNLTARPAILREKTWVIDRIAAGGSVRISDLETALDPVMLGGLDEAEFGQLAFHLSADGLDDVTIMHPIEMYLSS